MNNTTHKFNELYSQILANCYEILRSLATLSTVDGNVTRLILNLLRVLSFVIQELKDFDPFKIEFVYQQLLRYIYLGTPLISVQNDLSVSNHLFDTNPHSINMERASGTSTPIVSSSSEISDTDESKEK